MDSITAPGMPIPLTADMFCYPPVIRTRSHLAVRVRSSSVLATTALAPRNGVFLPPVTTRMRCRRKAIRVSLIGREWPHQRQSSVIFQIKRQKGCRSQSRNDRQGRLISEGNRRRHSHEPLQHQAVTRSGRRLHQSAGDQMKKLNAKVKRIS